MVMMLHPEYMTDMFLVPQIYAETVPHLASALLDYKHSDGSTVVLTDHNTCVQIILSVY